MENNECIRILHVFGRLNRGGAETLVMNLYRNIDRNRMQFDFMIHTDEKCDYEDEINKLGGKIHRISRYKGSNHFDYKKEWQKFFKEHPEYKIIHGHVRSTASIYLAIAKKFKVITLSHSHNTSSGNGMSALVKNVLQHRIRYIADNLIACSKESGEWLFGKNFSRKKNAYIINNAIDSEVFKYDINIRKKIRRELNLEDKFVIGHIGRFHPQKNHDFLIDVFNEVYKKNKKAILILIGEGELKTSIEEKVKKLKLDNNVFFAGTRSDISDLFQGMDVFVFPSLYEGLPLTLIEAQASGIPCIISENITKDVKITNVVEYVSLQKNEMHWAKIILKHTNNQHFNTYSQIVESGYDIKSVSKNYQEFLNKLLSMR